MGGVLSWFQRLFWQQEMEIAILGLQNAGKSSFVQVLNSGTFEQNMIPTVGFNMHKVQKGNVTIKVWDMGGQKKFRGMWERYCRGVAVIIFMIDASDEKKFASAQKELMLVAEKPLGPIPILVLFNKTDLPTAASPETILSQIDINSISGREVAYYPISCKNITNIDKTLEWLIKRANPKANTTPPAELKTEG